MSEISNFSSNTRFKDINTKDITLSINKELRENINWYQRLTARIDKEALPRTGFWWNVWSFFGTLYYRLGMLLQALMTKYWSSFPALIGFALIFNAVMGYIITEYPHVYEFRCPSDINWDWYDGFYYCIVTFTTLGYGDVTPMNHPAQTIAAFVALVGYFTLGVAFYLMSKKIDRKY